MRRYLLDTTPLGAYLRGHAPVVARARPWVRGREAATSILVYGELAEYLTGTPDFSKRRGELQRLLRAIVPIVPGYHVMERYGAVRRLLRPPSGPGLIGDIDTIIAATALEHDLILVTTDGDFERVPGLRFIRLHRRTFETLVERL